MPTARATEATKRTSEISTKRSVRPLPLGRATGADASCGMKLCGALCVGIDLLCALQLAKNETDRNRESRTNFPQNVCKKGRRLCSGKGICEHNIGAQ